MLNLRADGLRKIADEIPAALGRGAASQAAINRIAGEMQGFLASDVVYSQRVAPLIKDTRSTATASSGQQISGSQFLPNVSWLSPQFVANSFGKSSSSATGTNGAPGAGPARPRPRCRRASATVACSPRRPASSTACRRRPTSPSP